MALSAYLHSPLDYWLARRHEEDAEAEGEGLTGSELEALIDKVLEIQEGVKEIRDLTGEALMSEQRRKEEISKEITKLETRLE